MCTGKILLFDNGRKSRPMSRVSGGGNTNMNKRYLQNTGNSTTKSNVQILPAPSNVKLRKSTSIGNPSNIGGSSLASPKHARVGQP